MKKGRLHKLKDDLLEHCKLDYVGLWVVFSTVREGLLMENDNEVKKASLEVIRDLLEDGLVVVGDIDWELEILVPWTSEPKETLARIREEWDRIGRDPDHLEICWLTTTQKGDRWVEEHMENAPTN